jgi:hypothetical protein
LLLYQINKKKKKKVSIYKRKEYSITKVNTFLPGPIQTFKIKIRRSNRKDILFISIHRHSSLNNQFVYSSKLKRHLSWSTPIIGGIAIWLLQEIWFLVIEKD